MNVNVNANSFLQGRFAMGYGGLKSTQERMERKAECDNQVAFLEKQKENLKNHECGTIEEISRKLEMFHSYEDQIAAAKQAYNYEQMRHVMDEAMERAEKIAEAAEKTEYKTAEERKKEAAEEAMGTDEEKGALTEALEEMVELAEEMAEEMAEESLEELSELTEETLDKMEPLAEHMEAVPDAEAIRDQEAVKAMEEAKYYKRIDMYA